MNMQELIEKLNQEIKELKSTEASCFKLGSKTEELKFTNRIMGLQLALNWARRLNEPQKVTVPALVEEYIVWCHSEGLTLWEVFKTIRGMPEKVWEWLKDEDHQAIFSKAYTDGYEVEEEPKWVVNEGDLVVRRGEHEAKIYFVEAVHEDGILLVNGIKDEFYTNLVDRSIDEESVSYFYRNFRLLAKKENLEVEKEPKYIVPVPNLSKEFFYTADGQHISFCQRRNIDDVKSKVKFTLKEVERLFPELVDTVEKV